MALRRREGLQTGPGRTASVEMDDHSDLVDGEPVPSFLRFLVPAFPREVTAAKFRQVRSIAMRSRARSIWSGILALRRRLDRGRTARNCGLWKHRLQDPV